MAEFKFEPLAVGETVELSPATDWWMRGIKFGEVTKVTKLNVWVKSDLFNRTVRVSRVFVHKS